MTNILLYFTFNILRIDIGKFYRNFSFSKNEIVISKYFFSFMYISNIMQKTSAIRVA